MERKKSFRIQIAGRTAEVQALFQSTRDYCHAYLTEEKEDFSITVTQQDLAFEQAELNKEAWEEGFRLRQFTPPFLERAAIQRKVAEDLIFFDTLMLHGSAVAVDGKGYLFTAKCGTGKSTHTRLYREVFGSRAVMVNDDKPFLKLSSNGIYLCGAPWSGKHGLDSNIRVPLQGICILERGIDNQIRPMATEEALPMLLHQSYVPLTPQGRQAHTRLIHALAEKAPLWHLLCNKEPAAAILSHETMSAAANSI